MMGTEHFWIVSSQFGEGFDSGGNSELARRKRPVRFGIEPRGIVLMDKAIFPINSAAAIICGCDVLVRASPHWK